MSKADLTEANEHLDQALEHHAGSRHGSVKSRVELARGCVQRAIEGINDAIANPTAAAGAQASGGQSDGKSSPPRSADPEIRRQRDQLRSCEISFEARQRHLKGLR